jgi:hypothetical protein
MRPDAITLPARESGAPSPAKWLGLTALGVALWFVVYGQLVPFSEWVTARLGLAQGTHLAEAVAFFVYDTPKVLLLLTPSWPARRRGSVTSRRPGSGSSLPSAPARRCRSSSDSFPPASRSA